MVVQCMSPFVSLKKSTIELDRIESGELVPVGVGGEPVRGPHGDGGDEARAAVQQRVDDLHDVRLQGRLSFTLHLPHLAHLAQVYPPLCELCGRGFTTRTRSQF